MRALTVISVVICLVVSTGAVAVPGQFFDRTSATYSYPASYDAVVAAPEAHRIKFENDHVRLIEVVQPPGVEMAMHGHPHPGVFARDAVGPTGRNAVVLLDPESPLNGANWASAPAPSGLVYPTCTATDPQAPHKPSNTGAFPMHFYRVDFKRIDGGGLQQNWRQWYPWIAAPAPSGGAAPVTNNRDAVSAAPAHYKVRFEDEHLRFVEVGIAPGAATPSHGQPYASVLAFDNLVAFLAVSAKKGITESQSESGAAADVHKPGVSNAPAGLDVPRCMTTGPAGPRAITNNLSVPIHYYRIDFKRIDGEDFKTNWRQWYPHATTMR